MAKKGQKFTKYSPEFKLSVILDMRRDNAWQSKVANYTARHAESYCD